MHFRYNKRENAISFSIKLENLTIVLSFVRRAFFINRYFKEKGSIYSSCLKAEGN